MEFEQIRDNDKLTIKIKGRIDADNAEELEQGVLDSLDGVNELTFDMKDVEYVASAGLRVILIAKKAMGTDKSFKVINVRDEVMEIFEMVGFLDIIDFG